MSSVTSQMAQIGRRINYFINISGGATTGYTDVSQSTVNYNSWNVTVGSTTSIASQAILQDMGEVAKYNGQILRKVRLVTQFPAGGINTPIWIVVPGGEYPMQGYGSGGAAGALAVATVARLG
jgi:hypothetical protein